MRYTLEELDKKCKIRPQGYKEEILSHSTRINENTFEIDDSICASMVEKYRIPTRIARFKNLLKASGEILKSGIEIRSQAEIERVIEMCSNCEYLIEEKMTCGVCGCYLKGKTLIKAWHCPLKKW